MLKKLKLYIHSSKYQILRFLAVGVTSLFIDIGLLIFLIERINFRPVVAVATNQLLVILYNFIVNKYWSFSSKKIPFRQLIRYLILVAFNYVTSITFMYIFNDIFHIKYTLVRLSTIATLFIFNFICYKHWVYKET
ncbi:MAG: hypothetical protein COU35_03525 [Candidatus Magasanikbacteria bacterium CG10_big_fil_rev_8_21_14_0_10_47_10]|uniref:GtrA/DPMS transmembrane domain-containing protein n=1 Tax=Candidatus Magasanikbacteria bacterium CG10_big_fil_rev_8_21_14_0_10_47_10 TaxID=1974652 RepID=A0A2H0TQ08_9BACT|nr:MAG: hypothetical protein COU35_03525 [Candidatus Magasanikbacteria bacterium CG10_big_fil_rev_8_21_14_0_10_47_10]